ncbi:MAG: IPT/TIG domain-containing protein [Bifidobacteriaceae bacterium]|jgi:hypothetical protein|nr:IPT/TIG domain-containing protein [Bifidobacteriaceae bacterium]
MKQLKITLPLVILIFTALSAATYAIITTTLNPNSSNCTAAFELCSVYADSGNDGGGDTVIIEGVGFPDHGKLSDYAGYGVVDGASNGPIAWYDGKNNVGNGDLNPDDLSLVWKDLSGNGYDLQLRKGSSPTGSPVTAVNATGIAPNAGNCSESSWKDNAFKFAGYCYFALVPSSPTSTDALKNIMPKLPFGNDNYTMEIVYDSSEENSTNSGAGILGWGDAGITNQSNNLRFYGFNKNTPNYQPFVNYWWGNDIALSFTSSNVIKNMSVVYDKNATTSADKLLDKRTFYFNGVNTGATYLAPDEATNNHRNSAAKNTGTKGSFFVGIDSFNNTSDSFDGGTTGKNADEYSHGNKIFAIRIYNRPLSSQEAQNNYISDEQRFISPPVVYFGEKIDQNKCQNIVILSSTQIQCKTPAHAAGTVDITIDYKSQTSTLANGYTYNHPEINSITPNSGAQAGTNEIIIHGSHFPYAPSDSYVTDGLVAQYDGINNIGLGDEYNSKTTTIWKDLSGNGYDIVLRKGAASGNVTDPSVSELSSCSGASWSAGGFLFNGYCYYARVPADITAPNALKNIMPKLSYGGDPYTIEAVYDPTSMPANNNAGIVGWGDRSPGCTVDVPSGANNTRFMYTATYSQYSQAGNPRSFRHWWCADDIDPVVPNTSSNVRNFAITYAGNSSLDILRRRFYFMGVADDNGGVATFLPTAGCNAAFMSTGCRSSNQKNTGTRGSFIVGQNTDLNTVDTLDSSANTYSNGMRLLSLRVYNKALTNKQLQSNNAADQIRFTSLPTIKIGSSACTNVILINDTTMKCTAPAGTGADKPVTVQFSGGPELPAGTYSYLEDTSFYINSQDKNIGPKFGGLNLTFVGNMFENLQSIKVGSNICTIVGAPTYAGAAGTDSVTCTVPASNNSGVVDIKFFDGASGAGNQLFALTGAYTYLDATDSPISYRVFATPSGFALGAPDNLEFTGNYALINLLLKMSGMA